ncbi:unnamed protein product [Cuscuta campestris]|uniref:Uncharacterized protein n=1 Tax=Cuscuta campestris TaxID=132261 RepID=A0A484NIE0_9ASTE|nr:unnamed protein product [Cuscuta campestris]
MMADESAKRWYPEKLLEPDGGEAEASEIPSERDLDLEMVWSLLSDNDSDPAQAKKKGVLVPLDEVIIHTKTKKHDGKTWVDPGHAELQEEIRKLYGGNLPLRGDDDGTGGAGQLEIC